jgi:peptidoglycan/xylan/chitin deacetylase (PgdA/CDA1 family)
MYSEEFCLELFFVIILSMTVKKKRAFAAILIFFVLAGLSAAYFYHKIFSSKQDSDDLDYKKITNPEDFKPLTVPPEAIQKGRALVLPILMYHHVGSLPKGADKIQADLTVPTANFEAQVQWLKDSGYTSITLEDIYLASQGKLTLPKKPVVFTFDDGYEDVFQNAVPILKKYGYTGSFGIITHKPGTVAGENIYAPWSDIAQAYIAGEEIVSHTQTHFDGSNPKFTAGFIYGELSGSIADIKKNLGFATNILIYPYGHYTDTYLAQAKKAGLVMGVTVHEGNVINLDDLMELPRVRVHGAETLEEFEKSVL